MRRLVYYVGVSLDGYLAGPGGEYDFFPLGDDMAAWLAERYPETVPTPVRAAAGLAARPNRVFDTVVMGAATYRVAFDVGITSPYAHLRQYVVSRSVGVVDDPAVTIVREDPAAVVRALKAEDGLDIWLCGGGVLAGELLPLIDELVLKAYPVVAGAGRPVIAGAFAPTTFRPVEDHRFDNGTVLTRYVRS